jgi:hypothetical protein
VRLDDLLDLLLAAHENATPVMDVFRLDLEHALHIAVDGVAAGVLHDHRHGRALVQDAQFALGALLVGRVGKDAAVEQCAVRVCDHRADVARGIGLEFRRVLVFAGPLERVEVVDGLLVPVVRVALVHRVDGALLGDLHSRVREDELAECIVLCTLSVSVTWEGQEGLFLTRVKPFTLPPFIVMTSWAEAPYMVKLASIVSGL